MGSILLACTLLTMESLSDRQWRNCVMFGTKGRMESSRFESPGYKSRFIRLFSPADARILAVNTHFPDDGIFQAGDSIDSTYEPRSPLRWKLKHSALRVRK